MVDLLTTGTWYAIWNRSLFIVTDGSAFTLICRGWAKPRAWTGFLIQSGVSSPQLAAQPNFSELIPRRWRRGASFGTRMRRTQWVARLDGEWAMIEFFWLVLGSRSQ